MLEVTADILRRGLDALDLGVFILSSDLQSVIHRNEHARRLVGDALPSALTDALEAYILSRAQLKKAPPAMRVVLSEHSLFLRSVASAGPPPLEIVLLREELLRDVDAFRLLNARFGVSRREYQVLNALRLGKTNRQIASELGLAESTVALHVHHLLRRFDARNRTRLVNIVAQHISRR